MKTYACYPGFRTRFSPGTSAYQTPTNPSYRFSNEVKDTQPAANIIRNEGAYEIKLAVPGLSKDQVRIELKDDQLIISAVASEAPNQDSAQPKFIRREYDLTGFKRTFRLHKNADSNHMTARFEQGVLTIVIPDREPESIKIDIQ
jgi:HSP20 family protein